MGAVMVIAQPDRNAFTATKRTDYQIYCTRRNHDTNPKNSFQYFGVHSDEKLSVSLPPPHPPTELTWVDRCSFDASQMI